MTKKKKRNIRELTESERLVVSLVPGIFKGIILVSLSSSAAGTYLAKFIDVTPAT